MLALIDFDVLVYTACFGGKGDYLSSVETVDYYVDKIKNRCGEEFRGFLSGKNNFRYQVASILPYKGTRKSEKPPHYKAIREYLTDFYSAEIVDGKEADDALAEAQTDETVICSVDKDLKQVSGYHYNFKTDDLVYVEELDGITWFFTQLCIGDSTDNIPALKNPYKAFTKKGEPAKNPPNFTELTTEPLLKDKTPQEQLETVVDLFKQQYGEEWFKAFDEIATLLWIRRKDAITYKDCNLFNVELVKG